ncbi:YihY/virulence factor BrkB family protein [Rubrobacter calidifluminis]|uniref:YihY/virulence factor BrkB family protein n=1 Tax=Rubrobacter calidifluminis TaxID=1392640 RepID=UPI00235EDA60|nr:YihY/virulence factor BrkB family protein [Rubrobacter calidifluminis]
MAGRLKTLEIVKQTIKEVGEDHVMAFAGNLTYRIFFALFPFFVFLLSLLGIFGAEDLVNTLIRSVSGVMPASATQLIKTQLLSIAQSKASGAFTFGAIVSVLLALWGVSGAFRSVMEAMNVMYGVDENRPFWKVYGISIFISLAVIVLLVVALGIVVFGASVGGGLAGLVGLNGVFQTVWSVIQWPILACFVLLAFALVYYYAPAVTQRWRWISPGSVMALVFWVGFSLLFSVYVSTFGSYNATYGSFAGIIILLLYIYYSTVIVLVGAELNQVIEWRHPEGKDEGERKPKDEGGKSNDPKGEKI